MSDYQHWYYINKNYEEDGPVSSDELTRMAREGEIHEGTYVWTQELEEWVPASKVGGLFKKEKKDDVVKPIKTKSLNKKTGSFTSKKEADFSVKSVTDSPEEKKTEKKLAKLKELPEGTPSGFLNRKTTGFLTPTNSVDSVPPVKEPIPTRQPDRVVDSATPQLTKPLDSAPIPINGYPSIPAPGDTSTNKVIPRTGVSPTPVPLSAPVELVPKPITSTHGIPQYMPGVSDPNSKPISAQKIPAPIPASTSIPAVPTSSLHSPSTNSTPPSAAGANSIPAPKANLPSSTSTGVPPAPVPPGTPAPTPPTSASGLPQIPPMGRSVAPFNQTPTSALSQADDEQPVAPKKTPRPMSMEP